MEHTENQEITAGGYQARYDKTCPICGKSFRGTKRAVYCGHDCAYVAKVQGIYKWREEHREEFLEYERQRRRAGRQKGKK